MPFSHLPGKRDVIELEVDIDYFFIKFPCLSGVSQNIASLGVRCLWHNVLIMYRVHAVVTN